ncbi:hypothetical protein TSUD_59810 [Trifolium subterraneum]|uniref:Transposase (putative) gypsy type domain-containing protein n=1 Tax=Trifolium subterraneum TaxID=3900 RepID=A0A2Z6NT36_TRISU|nr:hypothetical protein TSUD_59810 [Trifolium subterraneum]
MLIIPMSSVTGRRGDVCRLKVKWTWTLCFGTCSTAQKWMSSTCWAFRPSPEQEPPKSSCSGTRMHKETSTKRPFACKVMSTKMSLAYWGRRRFVRLGEASLLRLVEEGNVWGNIEEFLRGIVAHLLRSMDVTWMDKPLHPPPPRVKATLSTQVPVSRFESRGWVTAVGFSRPFTSAMSAFGPLDLANRGLWIKATVQMQVASLCLVQVRSSNSTSYSLNFSNSEPFQVPNFQLLRILSVFRVRLLDSTSLLQLTSVMAEEQAPASTSNVDGDEYEWVADEPRTTVSRFSLNGGDGMFRTIQRPPIDDWKAYDWKACIPNTNRRICSKFQWGSFPMYQIAFEHMGYRLPFSDFEVAVFRYLHLTPSQLHPNSLAFIRAFEMTAAYLGFLPTIPLFFHAFHLQRSKPKGNAANKFGWVSLKQSVKLFEMFLESVRGFKDSYFFIKPLNSVSWQSIIYRGPAKDATGAPLIGPDGRPILEDYSRFPLSWRKSHYLKPASDFIYSAEELTVEEMSNYEQMKVFVGSFPRKSYEDEEGNPVLDESGAPLTKKSFIDTRRLLACKSAAEMEACFREMSSIAAKLRKSKAAKEKRQAAVLGSSSTAAPSPGGSDMDTARGGTVVVDLDDTVANTNADNQPRPTKVARVGEGDASATGLTPPSSSKFMLPPAIGSPDLVKKSSVSISDAEKAIMDDMGPEALKNELTDAMVSAFKLMEISSYLNGRECKYLAERDSAKEEAALLRQSLEQAKVNHAAYRDRYKLQAGLVTQLTEKEKLEGQVGDLIAEKETLEGKVKALESRSGSSSAAPDSDELVVDPNDEYRGFTRAALVSRIFELEAQQLDAAKSSFDNAVAQLMVLNLSVDLVVEGASEFKEVQDGVIVSPAVEED